MKYLLLAIGGVALALVAASRLTGLEPAEASEVSDESLFTARRGRLVVAVTENGYLKAKNSVQVQPQFKGSGTLTWLVDEGELVEEGQVLAEFEKTELENDIADKENSLIQYETELEAARAMLAIQERDNVASIEKAQLQVELKELELQKYEEGEYPNELRKLKLAAEKAESEHERAKRQYEEVPELVEAGFMTKSQEEEERIRLREAEINRETALKDLELYESFTYRMQLTQKKSDLKDARRELENAQAKADINLKEKQARVNQHERQVTSTKTRLTELRQELDHMTMRAPAPGIVHYGDPERPWYTDQVKIGNRLRAGNTMFTLPDLREMQVLLEVHEADIDRVEEGLDVVVTIETHKGKSFRGKVTEVASVATTEGWGGESSKRFTVEVTLDEMPDAQLRAGVTAKAEIHVKTLEDVVHVPIHAVVAEGEKRFCFVWKNGEVEQRTVEVGENNVHYVEVVAGLEAGERVLLRDPRGRSGGAGGAGAGAPADEDDVGRDEGSLGPGAELSAMEASG